MFKKHMNLINLNMDFRSFDNGFKQFCAGMFYAGIDILLTTEAVLLVTKGLTYI